MNKFNIDEPLFYSKHEIGNSKAFNPVLVRVQKIEKITNGQIIYTVTFISTVGWETKDRQVKQAQEMAEDCLYRNLEALKEVHAKATKYG